jgi:hypothetical protein
MATRPDQQWSNGYERGRIVCITGGAPSGRQWLKDHRPAYGPEFLDGFERAIFDYLDMNGLPGGSDPLDSVS